MISNPQFLSTKYCFLCILGACPELVEGSSVADFYFTLFPNIRTTLFRIFLAFTHILICWSAGHIVTKFFWLKLPINGK